MDLGIEGCVKLWFGCVGVDGVGRLVFLFDVYFMGNYNGNYSCYGVEYSFYFGGVYEILWVCESFIGYKECYGEIEICYNVGY